MLSKNNEKTNHRVKFNNFKTNLIEDLYPEYINNS